MKSINLGKIQNKIDEKEIFGEYYSDLQKHRQEILHKSSSSFSFWKVLFIAIFVGMLGMLVAIFPRLSEAFGGILPNYGENIVTVSTVSNGQTITYTTASQIEKKVCNGENCDVIKVDPKGCTGLLCALSDRKLLQTDNKTNILLTGIDSLGLDQGNADGGLTDTIILASFDHKLNKLFMISFPRDISVSYRNYYNYYVTTKINEVYYNSGWLEKDHDKAISGLSKVVSDMTGLTIHYNSLITISGLQQLVDNIGGISVNVEKSFTDVYPTSQIPTNLRTSKCSAQVFVGDGYYCEFTYNSGIHELSGLDALMYARSRKYSTDYDRGRRQQQVISAIKDKIVSSSVLLNPQKIMDILSTLKNNIKTSKYDANDILAAINLKDNIGKPVSIVLDPNFGGLNTHFYSGENALKQFVVNVKDPTYIQLRRTLNNYFENSDLLSENSNIYLYSDLRLSELNSDYNTYLIKDGNGINYNYEGLADSNIYFNLIKTFANIMISQDTLFSKSGIKYRVYLVDHTNGMKPNTVKKILQKFPEILEIKGSTIKKANNEDLSIIVDSISE